MSSFKGAVHEIGYNYNIGETPANIAIRQLTRISQDSPAKPSAMYLAGEINLQEASQHDAANGAHYQAAGAIYLALKESDAMPIKYQASWRMAQFPILRRIYAAREFPTREQAIKTYVAGLGVADNLCFDLATRKNHEYNGKNRSEASGVLAEMAVWGLLMDFSIKEGLTNCWLPSQSMLKDDLGYILKYKSTMRSGVDLNILTPDDNDGAPVTTYKIQVKKSAKIYKPYWPDVKKITVDTELASDNPGNASTEIIKDLLNLKGSHKKHIDARARTSERIVWILAKLG